MQAWSVIRLAESGKDVVVDTAQAFANDVMNGVKVLVTIEGRLAHYVAQVLPVMGLFGIMQYSALCCKACQSACSPM